MGFYSLVTHSMEQGIAPARGLPPGRIRVVHVGRLAIDRDFQGRGLLKLMVLRALRQTEEAARSIGIYALVPDALDEAARAWYLHLEWGFEALLDTPEHLFLLTGTIRQLGLAAEEPVQQC